MIEKFFGDLIISCEDIEHEFTLVPGDKFNLRFDVGYHCRVYVVRVSDPLENEERNEA